MSESSFDLPASRRLFLGAMTAASYNRVLGANDRVNIGFIGCGLIGLRHIADFKTLPDAALTAVSDVYQPRIDNAQVMCGSSPKGYQDFRKLPRPCRPRWPPSWLARPARTCMSKNR